jgi:hypothetical protein
MAALSDAARLGRSVENGVLYCTTFPCHMCAKHIVASGISNVVFLEPYPKSLTVALHSDSVQVEGADRGEFQEYPCVEFDHFFGVTPRRYREVFERSERKSDDGLFITYIDDKKIPNVDIKFPFYQSLEEKVIDKILDEIQGADKDEFFEQD